MLKLDIRKKLGDFSLDLKFDLARDSLALLGASGSGKSMTLKCIAGIEKPDEGEIILNNKILFSSEKKINLSPQARRLGLLFQSYALFPNMTLRDNILIACRNKDKRKEVGELIDSFSLTGLEDHYPHQLSGGQKQRTALARMIINEPEILMLDEPFSALDEHLRDHMEAKLARIIGNYQLPTIYVSHNKDEVYRLSDQVAVISKGKLVEYNDKESIFRRPQTYEAASLIGHKNISQIDNYSGETYLKDFGITLDMDSSSYSYVSLPSEALEISMEEEATDSFIIKDIIFNIDYTSLILVSSAGDFRPIYLDIDRERQRGLSQGDKIGLRIRKDRIHLLK